MWERYNLSGQNLLSQGRPGEAEKAFEMAVAEAEKMGPKEPKLPQSLLNLANCLRQQGRLAEAEAKYKAAIQIKEQQTSPLHAELVPYLENYSKMLRAAGREPEAAKMEKKAHAIWSR